MSIFYSDKVTLVILQIKMLDYQPVSQQFPQV